jgi:hypothetical protein
VKSRLLAVLVAALLAAAVARPLHAADPAPPPAPTVKMPAEVKIPVGRLGSVVIESSGKVTKFGCLSPEVDIFREYDPTDPGKIKVRFIAYTPGKYAIYAYTAVGDVPSDPAVCWLTVGDPVPPTPPTPPAPPNPPAPPTPVAENPFGAQPGLRVLIVYDQPNVAALPAGQFLVLQGKKFRDYLDAKCAPNGYRMFDQKVKSTGEDWWVSAMKKTDRKSVPWIYIGKEATGYSGPLPADPDATIALVSKYAGN